MGEPAAAPAPPMTELEGLQLKCNEITDESLESTRRMVGVPVVTSLPSKFLSCSLDLGTCAKFSECERHG